jgi:hypothetical protein
VFEKIKSQMGNDAKLLELLVPGFNSRRSDNKKQRNIASRATQCFFPKYGLLPLGLCRIRNPFTTVCGVEHPLAIEYTIHDGLVRSTPQCELSTNLTAE